MLNTLTLSCQDKTIEESLKDHDIIWCIVQRFWMLCEEGIGENLQ